MYLSFNISIKDIFGAMRESDEREMAKLLKTSLGGGLTEESEQLLNDLKYAIGSGAGCIELAQIAREIYKLNENNKLIKIAD